MCGDHQQQPQMLQLDDDEYDRLVVALKRAYAAARGEVELHEEWAGLRRRGGGGGGGGGDEEEVLGGVV